MERKEFMFGVFVALTTTILFKYLSMTAPQVLPSCQLFLCFVQRKAQS